MTFTRYAVIPDSSDTDTNSNYYPDIMQFPVEDFKYSQPPVEYTMTEMDIDRFDLLVTKFYGSIEYSDIILWLNNVEYIHRLSSGDSMLLPLRNDIDNFYIENKV